jgi:hypothetical protein
VIERSNPHFKQSVLPGVSGTATYRYRYGRSEVASELLAPHGVPGVVAESSLPHELGLRDRAHRTHRHELPQSPTVQGMASQSRCRAFAALTASPACHLADMSQTHDYAAALATYWIGKDC